MHAWPLLRKHAFTAIGIAFEKSASLRMMFADFPPSSNVKRFIVSSEDFATSFPMGVDPVNAILATSGLRLSSAPTISPSPVTKLTTPAGSPASWKASIRTWVCIALISLGLMTTVQPAAMAGATLMAIEPALEFHGVKTATTPSGS